MISSKPYLIIYRTVLSSIPLFHRRKFRSQTSDKWTDEKQRWGGKSQRREEKKKEDQERQRVGRQKMQVREKVAKSRNTAFFQWFVASEGWKVSSLKRRVRSHVVRWEIKSCAPLWREAHLLASEKAKNTSRSELRCRKSARRCGAKHISKSKVLETDGLGAILEVEMSKKCTPLWREADFEVKSQKC